MKKQGEKKVERSLRLVMVTVFAIALSVGAAWADGGPDHQATQARPIQLGTSGSNINDYGTYYCCSGTLGALVQDSSGVQYVLSNNHVLGLANDALPGEQINQPGQIDQGCGQAGVVAVLDSFVPIKFYEGRRNRAPSNTVDAAIAEVLAGQVREDGAILDIGAVSSNTMEAFMKQSVQKSGRTTGLTTGTVRSVNVTVDVGYSGECGGPVTRVARFKDQIRIEPASFSAGGDSGSLIVENGSVDPVTGLPRAVGLLFAGTSTTTLANPIDDVLSQLGVTMVEGPPPATGSVSGTVVRALSGVPISGALVQADTGQSVNTLPGGTYQLLDVPVGNRTITASAVGHEPQEVAVTVVEGGDVTANLALNEATIPVDSRVGCIIYNTQGGKNGDKHMLVTVTVVDNLKDPVADAEVTLTLDLDDAPVATTTVTTDASGAAAVTMKNAANGFYKTTVTDVVKAGLTFLGVTPDNGFDKGVDPVPATFCSLGVPAPSAQVHAGKARVTLKKAREVKAKHGNRLMDFPGVAGHGISMANGSAYIEIYAESEEAAAKAKLPKTLDDVPVKVIVTGPFIAY